MALILCAQTFMYVSARSVGDDEYKRDFLTPLIEDLHSTLIARNRAYINPGPAQDHYRRRRDHGDRQLKFSFTS